MLAQPGDGSCHSVPSFLEFMPGLNRRDVEELYE